MLTKNEVLQNRYRIVSRLGQGGMGAVYEARDENRFGKAVALKEILLEGDTDSDLRHEELLKKVFEREAKILSSLEHVAFPQVIDYFIEGGNQFLAMELVQGENLSSLLEKRGCPFELDVVLNWAQELLDALEYLHGLENPVYHRDIKPQNIKLSLRGRIKLLDFGIAKASRMNAGLTITNQTFVAATLHYSPLEQIIKAVDAGYREFLLQNFGGKFQTAENDRTDERSDLYALGATIYHLLTNVLPVDSLKRAMETFIGKADPLPAPHVLNPQIPPTVSAWILKAMEIEKTNRFSGAREMLASLEKAIEANFLPEKDDLENRPDLTRDWHNKQTLQSLMIKDKRNCAFGTEKAKAENSINEDFSDLSVKNASGVFRTATSYLKNIEFENKTAIRLETYRTIEAAEETLPAKNSRLFVVAVIVLFVLFSGITLGLWSLRPITSGKMDEKQQEIVQNAPVNVVESTPTPAPLPEPEPSIVSTVSQENTPVETKAPIEEGVKTVPPVQKPEKKPEKKPKNNPKKYDPCKPVTVDCIISDNR